MSEAKKYKAAVIGCGIIGADVERYSASIQPATHAGAFYNNEKTKLAALVDLDENKLKKAQKNFPGVPTFKNVLEMLVKINPDIVSVATPVSSHAALTEELAAYGPRAIICEKPIAATAAEAERMIKKCQDQKTLLIINHTCRFDPLVRKIKEKLAEFGPIVQGAAYYTRGIHNNGTHVIDLLRFYLGEVREVAAWRNKKTEYFPDLKDDFNIDGFLFFDSGARVVLQSLDARNYSIFDLYFYGQHGRIFLKYLGYLIYRVGYAGLKNSSIFTGHKELHEKETIVTEEPRSLFRFMAAHVVDCLEGRDSPVSTGQDGLAALKIISALRSSAEADGKLIRLN